MQGLGGTGAQQAQDCSFQAGTVAGAPLRVSWFLVIFFVYQLIDAVGQPQLPLWVRVALVTGNELLLLFTVLCHEMGHGTMARRCGGAIAQVLLWPFGGICFTTRASGRDARQSLVDDLWIVAAGPITHFPMSAAWLCLAAAYATVTSSVAVEPAWHHLIPFKATASPCISEEYAMCFQTYTGWLTYMFLTQAISLNVMLFMFNVFFPMYPMDGAKLIVCSLQLFCNASARFAAKVLIYTSGPLAVLFIVRSFMGMRGGALQPGISAYMGIMCLMEAYKIHTLMKEERLYTHPLFGLARSQTVTMNDPMGAARRLNTEERDDPEQSAPRVQHSEARPFSGAGRTLVPTGHGGQTLDAGNGETASTEMGRKDGRAAFLNKLEKDANQRGKTVRELEDERLQALEQQRLTGASGGGA